MAVVAYYRYRWMRILLLTAPILWLGTPVMVMALAPYAPIVVLLTSPAEMMSLEFWLYVVWMCSYVPVTLAILVKYKLKPIRW